MTLARWLPDGRRLLAVADDELRLWDSVTGTEIEKAVARGPLPGGDRIVWQPGGASFLVLNRTMSGVQQWSLRPLAIQRSVRMPARVTAMAANTGGRRIALGLSTGQVLLLSGDTLKTLHEHRTAGAPAAALTFAGDDVLAAVAGSALLRIELASGSDRRLRTLGEDSEPAVAASHDGRWLAHRERTVLTVCDASTET